MSKRRFHMAERGPGHSLRIADEDGRIVCTLPHDEQRLVKFILLCLNWAPGNLRRYDRQDWWAERNTWRNEKASSA